MRAAPDLGIDGLHSRLREIINIPNLFIILMSKRDKAFNLSDVLTGGHPCAYSGVDTASLKADNITVLNRSNFDSGRDGVFAN